MRCCTRRTRWRESSGVIAERRFGAAFIAAAQRSSRLSGVCTLALLGACGEHARSAAPPSAAHATDGSNSSQVAPQPHDSAPAALTYVEHPDTLRGLYVNRWAALGDRLWQLVAVAKRSEINALVIDVKDDRGLVLYKSRVPLAHAIGVDTNSPMSQRRLTALFDSLRANNIYPIARIVGSKDPLLANARL